MRKIFCVVIAAIASVLTVTTARADGVAGGKSAPLPIADFTKYDEVDDIRLSPSGQYVAFLAGKFGGRSGILVMNLKDKKIVGGIRCPTDKLIYDYEWSSNTQLVLELAEQANEMAGPARTGEIMAADFSGRGQTYIYGYRPDQMSTGTHLQVKEKSRATPTIVSTLRQDDNYILIAEQPWKEEVSYWHEDPDAKTIVTRLNTTDGRKDRVTIAPLANATILVDHQDQVRFAIGRDEKHQLAISWKPEPKAPWVAFNFPGFRDDSIKPQIFGADDRSVLFIGIRDGEKYSALYRLDLQTKEVTQVFAFENTGIERVIFDFAHQKAIGVRGHADKLSIHWLDKDDRAAKIYAALYRAFPDHNVYITSATEDGKSAVVFASSDVDPGVYYLFDTTTMHADLLRAAQPWIDPEKMRHKTRISLKARDGLDLYGYVTQPEGKGPFPMVVHPHGGPHGIRDYWDYDPEVQMLANRGFAVLQIDFRGSGGYGVDFEKAGYEQWGAKMQDDVTDATQWAIDQKIALPDRICIYGASYGGYAALMGAVREPKLYRCAVGYAGIYDLEMMLSTADISRSNFGRSYLDLALGTNHDSMHERSPAYHADKIEVPVLLIHGKDDWRADFKQAKKMKAALDANRKQSELMPLSHEGHGAYDEATKREVAERIVKFLDQHLQPTAGAQ